MYAFVRVCVRACCACACVYCAWWCNVVWLGLCIKRESDDSVVEFDIVDALAYNKWSAGVYITYLTENMGGIVSVRL